MSSIFSKADILLPDFSSTDYNWTKWSIIACDQFTSQPKYWEDAQNIAGDFSTLSLILPEAWLNNNELKTNHEKTIENSMISFPKKLVEYKDSMIYIVRKYPNGVVHKGLVGKIDLEKYDYLPNSKSNVRATEATVLERIPPRETIRSKATIELPHIMILINEKEKIFNWLNENTKSFKLVYDFDLMLDGGHIQGYLIEKDNLSILEQLIEKYESNCDSDVIYSIGDGNHSLAAAKSCYNHNPIEKLRYALAEITSINDDAIQFEPIYRLVMNPGKDFLDLLYRITEPGVGNQTITIIDNDSEEIRHFKNETHPLIVGSLQNFIDDYISKNSNTKCDYIHGVDSLKSLAKNGNIGFIFDGISKYQLFDYVSKYGVCPRKTFSLGEAKEKRYYIEARKIK